MRRLAMAFAILVVVALPALAVQPSLFDEPYDGTAIPGGGVRTNDCPGAIVWDSGMFDEFTPPTGCSTAGSAFCFVQAIGGEDPNDPEFIRIIADDFEVGAPTPITHVKVWARYSASGYAYHRDIGGLYGFCIRIYEQDAYWCPDGTVPGEDAIGTVVYDDYSTNFSEFEVLSGLPRHFNYCITMPSGFVAQPGKLYWMAVTADFDLTTYDDPETPAIDDGVTQWFWRMYEGQYDPYCDAQIYDVSGSTSIPQDVWNAISVNLNIPCWAGYNAALVIYSNDGPPMGACCVPGAVCVVTSEAECQGTWYAGIGCDPDPCEPIPTEETSWGQIKNLYR